MLISRQWLQTFFDKPLPSAVVLADALTFHIFEIDGIEKCDDDDVLDVKITANRGHDCNSYRGIAREISAILQIPMKRDPFLHVGLSPKTNTVRVQIENPALCQRYVAGVVRGIKVGPSPEWLRERLASMGQRSINNIVDATNFVMFETGQPLHAFDAEKTSGEIGVRYMRGGESLDLLKTTKEVKGGGVANLNRKIVQTETGGFVVIADDGGPLAIAGVKGGERAAVTETTASLILESACFDGVAVRKASRSLNIRTDASARFEHGISPELAAHGMRALADLIVQIAGGEIEGFVDTYPQPMEQQNVSVTLSHINNVLGIKLSDQDVTNVFSRLGFGVSTTSIGESRGEGGFTVSIPLERLDITIPEDLIEEVVRIIGYDAIPATPLPPVKLVNSPQINKQFYIAEKVREDLMSHGYSEVFTSVFAESGERMIANKADSARPYLRTSLVASLSEALKKNICNKALLGLSEVKIFEIGTVWRGMEELIMVGVAEEKVGVSESTLADYMPTVIAEPVSYEQLPISTATHYQPFSKYPFIVRDVAMWVPVNLQENEVIGIFDLIVTDSSDNLSVTVDFLDRFEKNGRISLAFRLVFQSFDRTLEDGDANEAMEKVYVALRAKGFEIR